MEDIDIVKICRKVLDALIITGSENSIIDPVGHLIFPAKNDDIRISEQELRQVFIDKFKDLHENLYYSIETPTKGKYNLGKNYDEINVCNEINNIIGQSALIDMSVFKRNDENKLYKRIINIEFKHQNAPIKDIGKDVLKLMYEDQKGAFIFLLDNTNKGSLNNPSETRKGVMDKLNQSFINFRNKEYWKGDKNILIVIMSLKEKSLIYRTITNEDFDNRENNFSINSNGFGNIKTVSTESGWTIEAKF